MKRALVLCLFLAASANMGMCSSAYFPPLQPLDGTKSFTTITPPPTQNYNSSGITGLTDANPKNAYSQNAAVHYPKVDKIERALYGQIYAAQDITVRLARIEMSMFSTTYPASPLIQRVDNIVANFNQINQHKNISMNALSSMESKVFHQKYPQDTAQNRVERLEQQIFGAVQDGDITARYETLKTATTNYNANQYAQNPYQNPFGPGDPFAQTANNQGRMKGVLGNLGNMLLGGGGAMTGFTPSIDPLYNSYNGNNGYNSYNGNNGYNGNNLYNGYNGNSNGYNNYNNNANLSSPNGYGLYNGNRTNHGYSDIFKSYGTGSRVTILD